MQMPIRRIHGAQNFQSPEFVYVDIKRQSYRPRFRGSRKAPRTLLLVPSLPGQGLSASALSI